jgi:cysteine synthase
MSTREEFPLRVLVFGASLREGSVNERLASLAAAVVEQKGGTVDRATMAEFACPSYDGDVEAAEGIPPGAQELHRRLNAADAFMISSPEYNTSMPGVLKNVIDWVSRFRPQPWTRKHGWMLSQITNPGNPGAHYRTTGPEIWEDTAGEVDVLVAGVGTGGTITGTGHYLREQKPRIRVVAVEPAESPLLARGEPGPHQQVGLSGGFVADVMDTSVYDEIVHVTNEEAFETTRRLAREEAIFVGISSGSAAVAALRVAAREESRGKLIVAMLPDAGDRYLSNPVFAEMPEPDFSDVLDALE